MLSSPESQAFGLPAGTGRSPGTSAPTLSRKTDSRKTHSLKTATRQAAEQLGRYAEAAAEADWVGRGYRTLARRLRTAAGELDLVMANGEHLVFVEVKARACAAAAAYAVSPRQQARLFSAAEAALAAHGEWLRPNIRFDVALVCAGRVEPIEDALRLS
ncbi:MAG TPA: YraN family protein [Acidocella sp.]|nr:MAG: hypothetical protein B7Z81_09170 [Acidocella sp. 20-61-6]HQT47822.1 YraN family protein [Acidocella sp.]